MDLGRTKILIHCKGIMPIDEVMCLHYTLWQEYYTQTSALRQPTKSEKLLWGSDDPMFASNITGSIIFLGVIIIV